MIVHNPKDGDILLVHRPLYLVQWLVHPEVITSQLLLTGTIVLVNNIKSCSV